MATLNDTPAGATTALPGDPSTRWNPAAARHVAQALLAEFSSDDLRGDAEEYGHPVMFRAVADAMDELLAEGFDPAAFAAKLRAGSRRPAADGEA